MKIAFILPKLVNQAPVLVVKDLIGQIHDKVSLIEIYYFEGKNEIGFECACHKISFFDKIDFDKYDIIHSHMLRPDLYIWHNKKYIKNAKCVSTLHNDIYKVLKDTYNVFVSFFVNKIWLFALRYQDAVVMLSQNMKKQYSRTLKENKLHVIYNGRSLNDRRLNAEIDAEDIERIKKLKSNYKIIGVSARLMKIKGFSQLVQVLPDLKEYALIFVGEGQEKENLIDLSLKLGVYERCLFLGYRKDGHRYLYFFDFYAMTSYSEGFPLGLLEAAQFKLPVVCSKLPIFKELFDETEVSYFELDDIKSLKEAILYLEKNKYSFLENFSRKVAEKYTVEMMSKNYLMLYNKMINF